MKYSVIVVSALLTAFCIRMADASPSPGHMVMPAVDIERVSSGFGDRHDGFHPGVDLAAPYGSPVRAALSGRVVYAGWYGEYGKVVDISSRDGLLTRYAHLSQIGPQLVPGRTIMEGSTIGNIGTTGNAHGAHLHFEVRVDSRPVDPMIYLASTKAPLATQMSVMNVATGSSRYHASRKPVHGVSILRTHHHR
ncbi:M23 family metallopeptidase [Acidiphilium sp.]|uniref:M23 family metallopeptidase n=1 Tax=Acidiphilium sp. TaxID=527 RepID=UPI0025908613|nr:M23 family metallopeptidase [Acidiphilium sp.]